MKNLATILCIGIIGFAQAQSTSKEVEIYERYENGELVEQRQSATENGIPIENGDFEKLKREMQLKSAEIKTRSNEMMQKVKQSMDVKMKEMELKMVDFEKRSEEMHQRMDQKMKEMNAKSKENKKPEVLKSPAPITEPAIENSTEDLRFT